jgi:hypothetical protein
VTVSAMRLRFILGSPTAARMRVSGANGNGQGSLARPVGFGLGAPKRRRVTVGLTAPPRTLALLSSGATRSRAPGTRGLFATERMCAGSNSDLLTPFRAGLSSPPVRDSVEFPCRREIYRENRRIPGQRACWTDLRRRFSSSRQLTYDLTTVILEFPAEARAGIFSRRAGNSPARCREQRNSDPSVQGRSAGKSERPPLVFPGRRYILLKEPRQG